MMAGNTIIQLLNRLNHRKTFIGLWLGIGFLTDGSLHDGSFSAGKFIVVKILEHVGNLIGNGLIFPPVFIISIRPNRTGKKAQKAKPHNEQSVEISKIFFHMLSPIQKVGCPPIPEIHFIFTHTTSFFNV